MFTPTKTSFRSLASAIAVGRRSLSFTASKPIAAVTARSPSTLTSSATPTTPAQRLFHSSRVDYSQRTHSLARIRSDIPRYNKIELDSKQLLEALRSLQAERTVNGHPDKAAFYSRASYDASYTTWKHAGRMIRDGLRDISLVAVGKSKVTLGEIEDVLSAENGVTWTLIRELVEDGRVARLEMMGDEERAAVLFNRVHGMGIKNCWSFAENGARTLEDLRERTKEKSAVQLGLDHFEDMEVMIPREEIEEFKMLFEEALAKDAPLVKFEILGSFRRGEALSSDIDMVIWHPDHPRREPGKLSYKEKDIMASVKAAFTKAGLLQSNKFFSNGEQKVMALTKLDKPESIWRQIDIRLCPVESLPYMLVGNTGDDNLMRLLRLRAKNRGLVLNEYCMGKRKEGTLGKEGKVKATTSTWPVEGTEIIVKEEKEIFDHLDLPYLEPSQRSFRVYETIYGKILVI